MFDATPEVCRVLSKSHYSVSKDEKSIWHKTLSATKLMSNQLCAVLREDRLRSLEILAKINCLAEFESFHLNIHYISEIVTVTYFKTRQITIHVYDLHANTHCAALVIDEKFISRFEINYNIIIVERGRNRLCRSTFFRIY